MYWHIWKKGKWREKRWQKARITSAGKCNNYTGKRFAILGDSISTLSGYGPKGYPVFYTSDQAETTGVLEIADTWWGKVIDFFGGELLVNNSWSGSRVTRLPLSERDFPSACSEERTRGLHIDNIDGKSAMVPDVILIYMGTNDWGYGVPVHSEHSPDGQEGEENTRIFDIAYDRMLKSIKMNYPFAEIWCCSLATTCIPGNRNFSFPYSYAGIHMESYNKAILNIARKYQVGYIDLYSHRSPYHTIDGVHPDRKGMKQLAEMVVDGILADPK